MNGIAKFAWRGWCGRCPNCNAAPLMKSWLRQVDACAGCGTHFGEIRADDGPPWLTILLVGHLIAPAMTATQMSYDPPIWVGITVWMTVALALAALLLPRAKGLFVAVIWATAAAQPDDGIQAADFE